MTPPPSSAALALIFIRDKNQTRSLYKLSNRMVGSEHKYNNIFQDNFFYEIFLQKDADY